MTPAAQPNDANPVRLHPNDKLSVAVHLTPFAPGVGPEDPVDHARRGWTCWSAPAWQALGALFERLERKPGELKAVPQRLGDIALLNVREGEPRVPLAFIYDGLSADDFNHLTGAPA